MTLNDESRTPSLLERWHAGDAAALGKLVQRDLAWIRAHVHNRMGAGLRAKAETGDIVQEAMVHVLRDGPRFVIADIDQFRALVATIVENVLRTQNRAHRQQCRDISREEELPQTGVLDLDATSPSQAAIRSEETAWLTLGIELLDPSDRDVVVLRQWDGLPFADVADRLGVSENAARTRFHRALLRLAPLVERLREGQVADVLKERERRSTDG